MPFNDIVPAASKVTTPSGENWETLLDKAHQDNLGQKRA